MKRLMTRLVLVGVLAFGGGMAATADNPTGDKPEAAVTLPTAAATAIAKAFPKAVVESVKASGKEGAMIYDVAMTEGAKGEKADKGEKKFNVQVHESGIIISVSGPLAAADLPKPVADAVTAADAGATIKAVSMTERRADRQLQPLDKPVVIYEFVLTKGDAIGTMAVSGDGKVKRALKMIVMPKSRR